MADEFLEFFNDKANINSSLFISPLMIEMGFIWRVFSLQLYQESSIG
jgi:hypothetical protein